MKLNAGQAILILLVTAAVLLGIQVAVQSVSVSSLPTGLQSTWKYIEYVFDGGAAIVIFTFVRNIFGYAENVLQGTTAGATISYDASQLGATLTRYAVYVSSIQTLITALFAGTPYVAYAGLIAGAIGTIFDMILKSVNDLGDALKPTTTPTPLPTSTPAPAN